MTEATAPTPGPEPATAYRHILMATDFSDHAAFAARRAVELARLYDARLTLVNTLESPVVMDEFYDSMTSVDIDVEQAMEQRTRQRLEALRRELGAEHTGVEVLFGRAKVEIVRYAQDNGVDLIVLGSHGHHGLARLLGSTTDSVNHDAACDVLAVRLPGPNEN